MTLIISYDKYQNNWYVGELYDLFARYMTDNHSDIEIISNQEFAKKFDEPFGYRSSGMASVFNIYNLIVYNTNKNCSFLHSLADYAPVMLEHDSAINKLNIKSFAFSSNFTQDLYDRYRHLNINLIPSFYILENFDDIKYIEKYSGHTKIYNQCYFNGLCYGHRKDFINCLKNNIFFVMKNKSDINDFVNKEMYYDQLSGYKYGLSLNGAARICYRDIEYFGMKNLCIREPLNILTRNLILPDVHYKSVIDNNLYIQIASLNDCYGAMNSIIDKILSINNEEIDFILNNAYTWYQTNAVPEAQVKILYDMIIEENVI